MKLSNIIPYKGALLFDTTLLVNTIAVPIQLGLYQNGKKIKALEVTGQTSDVLPKAVLALLEQYGIERIVYANGPGSYMAIKLTYIMLRSVEMLRGIPLFGVSAFALNGNQPIKAMGNLYFIKEKETIMTKKFDHKVGQAFQIPNILDDIVLEKNSEPHYILPAV